MPQDFSLLYFTEHEPQLFKYWSELSFEEQSKLSKQLAGIDLSLLNAQKELIHKPLNAAISTFEPFNEFDFSGNMEDRLKGVQLIKEGRLGCLLLAGGQGTRLKIQGPKGKYPISLIKNKTLFQLIAEKVVAASKQVDCPLFIAVMTSPENNEETRAFFEENGFFGLQPGQIDFFIQDTLPFLDTEGKLFLENPFKLAVGPDGNGHSLLSFVKSGLWEKWKNQGVEYLNLIPVDNPLADPFDPGLLGFHFRKGVEISLKCTEKTAPEEKVGLVVKLGNDCGVVEYSEIPPEEKEARREDGRLKHCCANLSLLCFSMSFIERIYNKNQLPLHKAWKTAKSINSEGKTELSKEPIAWKFETFIFDWLACSEKIAALLVPREECFAPLKNFSGNDSPETVRLALQKKDWMVMKELTGLTPPDFPFEIAADFYYPTQELREKWKGKMINSAYIEP